MVSHSASLSAGSPKKKTRAYVRGGLSACYFSGIKPPDGTTESGSRPERKTRGRTRTWVFPVTKPLTLALSLKGRGNRLCLRFSPSPLEGEGWGEGAVAKVIIEFSE
jgi:hypothetical protein